MIIPPIVCLSTIDWDDVWQRHQIFASAFAAQGSQILFVENLGGRAPGVKDVTRVWRRVVNLFKQSIGGLRKVNGVTIISPVLLPWAWAKTINQFIFLPMLARQIHKLGFSNSIVWTYSPTSNAMRLVELLKPGYIVYDCVANIKGYSYATPELIASENELIRRADLVITDAQTLYEEKVNLNPRTFRVPPGVEFKKFDPIKDRSAPPELSDLPHPRLGFFGTLGWWVDYQMLRDFAVSNPDWTLVLIGPLKVDEQQIASLWNLPNVVWSGAKSHDALPAYLQALDVLCIPYVVDEFTQGVIPAKLFECLATGKPIVATPISEILAFSDSIVVTERSRFASGVITALSNDTLELREQRLKIASANSWAARFQLVTDLLAGVRGKENDETYRTNRLG